MIKLLFLFTLLFGFSAQAIEPDKQLHVISSYALSTTAYSALNAHTNWSKATKLVSAAAVTLLLGYAKERSDEQYDVADMNANAAGTTVAFTVSILLF